MCAKILAFNVCDAIPIKYKTSIYTPGVLTETRLINLGLTILKESLIRTSLTQCNKNITYS